MAGAGPGLWSARGPFRPNGQGGFSLLSDTVGSAVQQPHITRNPSPLQRRQTPLVRLPVPLQ